VCFFIAACFFIKGSAMSARQFKHNSYSLTDASSAFDLEIAWTMLTRSYWSPGVPKETVRLAAANSWTFSLLAPDGSFVGMARFVTDRSTFAYLADVIIAEDHRGQGLGRWMMTCLHDLPEIQACRRLMLMTADAHSLYRKIGYSGLAAPDRAMELHRPDIYRRTADQDGATL
jgi:GNAT superfamily N-acetyltransferase